MLGPSRLAERVQLFRELATLVNAGMSLGMALATLEERGASPELQAALKVAARKVSSGTHFSEVMRAYPRIFSELNVALIAAGEEGGRLDEMLTTAADYLEREMQFQQAVARETAYPKVLVVAVVLIPLAARVIIAAVTGTPAEAMLVALRFFGGLALFGVLPGYILYFLYRRHAATLQGRRAIDALKLRVPIFGQVIGKLAWSRICRALAALYGAGVNIRSAVTIAARTGTNAVIEEALMRTVPALERGEKLSDALAKTGQIPPLALSMLRTGEVSGGIDSTMEKVADYFEAEAHTTVGKGMVLIVPIAVILCGIVVFFMLAGAYGGYFSSLMNQ